MNFVPRVSLIVTLILNKPVIFSSLFDFVV